MPEFAPGPTMDQLPKATNGQEAAPETAPKRRGRPPGSKNSGTSTRSRKSFKDEIGGTLVMFNLALMAMPPTRSDALDPKEIELLADAIDNQAKISPTFRKYLTIALSATSGGQLISVVAIIGARRLARHEIILPKEADDMLGGMIGAAKIVPAIEPDDDSNNGTGPQQPDGASASDPNWTTVGGAAAT